MRLTLASQSPRRAKILADLGVAFDVVKTDAPEVSLPHDPEGTVLANARAKLLACGRAPALAADTIVWFAGKIYGKPRDLAEARAFLRELSGKADAGGGSSPMNISSDGHASQISDLAEAILTGRKPFLHGREGRRAIELICGIYESARTGKPFYFIR